MKIKLFITGGTIDARYNYLKSKVDYDKTHIEDMLSQGRAKLDIDIEQLMLVDSGDITAEQRQHILEKCNSVDIDKIVITHGTDTMVETARLLGEKIQSKTIVLVGSMIPYAVKGSDALFNLGAAISAVQILDKGIFITMNGKIFNWDNVEKNFDLGEFQALR